MKPGEGGNGGINQQSNNPTHVVPGLKPTTSAWTGGRGSGGPSTMRSFEEIVEQEKMNRNIIEINLGKASDDEEGKVKSLTFDDLGELIFDVLKVSPTDCLGFNFNTGRYNQREVKLKAEVDPSPFLTESAFKYKGHMVTVKLQRTNGVRVTFRSVPLNVPDEEIIHLCLHYGKPVENKVQVEKMTNIKNRGMPGSTRYVDMEIEKEKYFNNYYWMEGPLSGDAGKRVVVLHNVQPSQCSHCLLNSQTGCPAGGVGKACEKIGKNRATMSIYMKALKVKTGYVSLKIQYTEQRANTSPDWGRSK